MKIIRGIAVAGVALIASTILVQADGFSGARGSIKDDPIPVAPSCPSWYARVDGGYSTFDRPGMSQVGVDELVWARIAETGSIGGGIGKYFTCNIRGDITVDHRFESDVTGFNPNPFAPNYGSMKWGYSSTAIMGSMYYDFNMRSRITPYIGLGLGVVHNEFSRGKGTIANGAANPADVGAATAVGAFDSWQAAAAFMTGFAFRLSERLTLDTGYRFLYMGPTKTGDTGNVFGGIGGPIRVENIHAHELRLGLRYDIR